MNDEDLMSFVAQGDLNRFEEIVHRNQHSAWNIAFKFLGNFEEAEEVVQEAFLKIFDAAPRYRPTASFRTYLYRVIIHLCLDISKKKKPVYTDELTHFHDPSPSACQKLIDEERDLKVRTALDRLPSKQRSVVVLKYYEELCYKEIASIMEITEKAVERLLAKARISLHSFLSK